MEDAPAIQRFDRLWNEVEPIPGWLTREQGYELWQAAHRLRASPTVVEIGSHQGRSTVVLGDAVRAEAGRVVAIDPFVEGRLFGGAPTRQRFEANIDAAGLGEVVHLIPERSLDVRSTWDRAIDLLYVDGKHDYWTVTDDLRWVQHCRPEAPVLIHDAFSSVGVTLALLRESVGQRRLRYLGRVGSLARFVVAAPDRADRRRMWGEIPWWLRNIAIKVTLRLRLGRLTKALGHESTADPY